MQLRDKNRIRGVSLGLLIFFLSAAFVFAQSSSTNYQLKKSVLDAAGTRSQSTGYGMVDAVAQPTPPGDIFSRNYNLSPGFLGRAVTITFRGDKLLADDGAAEDEFARTLALGEDYAVIGAAQNDNENGINAGAAYLFKRSGNLWTQHQKIMADDGAENDLFGYAVAIDGDYLVAGAPWTDDNGTESGAAYIFKRDGTTWTQQAKLLASDGGEDNRLGITVAISGEYVIVGAFFDDDFGTRSGSAYIYKRTGTTWSEQAILHASDGAAGDWFGVSVSISGDFAAVGSRYDDNLNGTNAGGVYLFRRDGTTWPETQKIIAADGAPDDLFHKVSLAGDQLVVGASQNDENGSNAGAIYPYQFNGTTWVPQPKIMAGDGEANELFGAHVKIHANRMVVGAYRDDEHGPNSGSIYVYEYDGVNWNESEKISAFDGDPGDYYGGWADINSDFILVGARNDDDKGSNAGAAYVYGSVTTGVPFDPANTDNVTVFQLQPAYPNPFNPETTIRYMIPRNMKVEISIFNTLGQRVRLLENITRERGTYSVRWDGRDDAGNTLNSGVYICRIQAGEYRRTTKLTLLK